MDYHQKDNREERIDFLEFLHYVIPKKFDGPFSKLIFHFL